MISSDLTLRKHPVVVVDETTNIPDTIAERVSFKVCPKIFIDTPVSTYPGGKHVIVMKQYTLEGLKELIHPESLPNLLGVYTISGLDSNIKVNNRIPVFGSRYAESNGITDPSEHVSSFVELIATDIGYTTAIVPWKNSDKTRWRTLSYGVECVSCVKQTLQNTFPYSVWISHVEKKKDYSQRRDDIIAMNRMISSKQPFFDEIVLFGDGDYITKDRFPSSDITKVTYIPHVFKQPPHTVGFIFDYAWSKLPRQSLVFITRSDITLRNTDLTQAYCRFPGNVFGLLNPLVVPDVPDPKPELFQSGVPEVVYGCFYRTKKRPVPSTTDVLHKIHSHMVHSFGVTAEVVKQRKIPIVNPSRSIQSWVSTSCRPSFLKSNLASLPRVSLPVGGLVYASLKDSRESIWKPDTVPDAVTVRPIKNTPELTENKTLINMTNKYVKRGGNDNWVIDDSSEKSISIGDAPSFVNANDCLFYKDYWIHNESGAGSSYLGEGIRVRGGNLAVDHSHTHDGVLVGAPDIRITTLMGILMNTFLYNRDKPLRIIVPETCDSVGGYLHKIFDGLGMNYSFKSIVDGYIRGTTDTVTMTHNQNTGYLGYDPRMVRMFNREFHTRLAGSENDIMDVLGDVSPSKPTAIIVGAEKWRKAIASTIEKNTRIRLIDAKDATRSDYMNASYIIGTSETDDWAFTAMVRHTKCRVIEIAPEYDCNVKWFHLANTSVGCEHMYLSLKQEPSKQCKKRIKTHLMAYIREEDKVSSDEVSTSV